MTAAPETSVPVVDDLDSDEPVVVAYQLDWTFANLRPDEIPAGVDEDTVFYSEKYADQVWPHVAAWLAQVSGSDVSITRVEIPLSEWLDSFLGDEDEARRENPGADA